MSQAAPHAPSSARRVPRALRGVVERALLAGFGLIVAAVLGELALRLLQGQPLWPPMLPEPYVDNALLYRRTPRRLYELSPGADDVVGRARVRIRVNAAGLRDDREYAKHKAPGVRRLLVLGDSFTFAGKVPLEQTFPKRLERLLNAGAAPAGWEVLNLAVPGYNARQQSQNLEERGLAFEPDLVIVAFVLNDALPAAQLVPRDPRLPLPVRRFLKRFVIVQFLAASLKRVPVILSGRRFKGGSEVADLSPGTPGWLEVQESLVEMKRLAGSASAPLLLVIWPLFEGLAADYPFAAQHQQVSSFCSQHGIQVLDLLPTFRGLETETLWVARDDHHPNAQAQGRAAAAIHQGLLRLGLAQRR